MESLSRDNGRLKKNPGLESRWMYSSADELEMISPTEAIRTRTKKSRNKSVDMGSNTDSDTPKKVQPKNSPSGLVGGHQSSQQSNSHHGHHRPARVLDPLQLNTKKSRHSASTESIPSLHHYPSDRFSLDRGQKESVDTPKAGKVNARTLLQNSTSHRSIAITDHSNLKDGNYLEDMKAFISSPKVDRWGFEKARTPSSFAGDNHSSSLSYEAKKFTFHHINHSGHHPKPGTDEEADSFLPRLKTSQESSYSIEVKRSPRVRYQIHDSALSSKRAARGHKSMAQVASHARILGAYINATHDDEFLQVPDRESQYLGRTPITPSSISASAVNSVAVSSRNSRAGIRKFNRPQSEIKTSPKSLSKQIQPFLHLETPTRSRERALKHLANESHGAIDTGVRYLSASESCQLPGAIKIQKKRHQSKKKVSKKSKDKRRCVVNMGRVFETKKTIG